MFKKTQKIFILCLLGMVNMANSHDLSELSVYVNKEGAISFPSDFDTSMTHLGSWFVPEGEASGFHYVYSEKENVKAFQRDGHFPDGTTIVKELRASHVGNFTTGKGVSYSTSSIKQWFVMIKDSKNRFSKKSSWGDGWGWALFKPDNLGENLVKDYKTDCLGCHIPVKDKDWIYTEGYPILNK
jgi:hypothetical protein